MCFDHDASPPELPAGLRALPPLAGGAAGERETLTSADGTPFSAYLAGRRSRGAAVVILPDVRGLYRFYESSPSASPTPATTPSPSTTSGAPRPWARATTPSSTCRT